jgi:AraC-like DNA-binding protein
MQTLNGLEMALLQPLYARFSDRPALLHTLQTQLGLRTVNGQGKDLMATSGLLNLLELLHAEGEPHIGAWLAMQTDLSIGGGIAYYLRSCATLEAAVNEILRLRNRILPDGELSVQTADSRVRLVMRPSYQTRRLGRQLRYEGILGWLMRLLAHCVEGPLRPVTVDLMTPPTAQAKQLEAMFGVMPRFEQGEFAVSYHAAALAQPLPGSNPDLLAALRPSLDYMLPSIQHTVSSTQQVREWLSTLAQHSLATQTHAARAFNCGTSSLRRRLASEGTTFSALVQMDRRARALQELVFGEDSIEAIAARLGYADRTTLERAFFGWFAYRPVQLRNELAAAWPTMEQRCAALRSANTDANRCRNDAKAWLVAAAAVEPPPQAAMRGPRVAALLMCAAGMPAAAIRQMREQALGIE